MILCPLNGKLSELVFPKGNPGSEQPAFCSGSAEAVAGIAVPVF